MKNRLSRAFYPVYKKEAFIHNIKALFAVLAAVSLSMANISGKVTDTSGTIPISGAAVQLEKGGQTTTTGADGSFTLTGIVATGINEQMIRPLSHRLLARINNGVLYVDGQGNFPVEISAFNLQGQAISTLQKTMSSGTSCIALPSLGAGVYLYKVKSGNDQILIKNFSGGNVSGGTALSLQSTLSNSLAKQVKVTSLINDVIAVTKDGFLNYRVIVTNSDTSGIEIKMIVCAGTVIDMDENVYQTVKIGNQVWMAENLRTTKYNDGSAIPLMRDSAAWNWRYTPGYYYYPMYGPIDDSIKRFGALYNWYTVDTKKLAPAGWHVPTDSEWTTLENYLVVNGYTWNGTTDSNKIAKSLAANADWAADATTGAIGNDLTKNNKSGFSALPGGYINANGHFITFGHYGGYWWSATKGDATGAYLRCLFYDDVNLIREFNYMSCGLSVRLVKDN